jgi:hypothetical protein
MITQFNKKERKSLLFLASLVIYPKSSLLQSQTTDKVLPSLYFLADGILGFPLQQQQRS